LQLGIIVVVIIMVLSILLIPSGIRYIVTYVFVGIFFSGSIMGSKIENETKIIANMVVYCGIIAACYYTDLKSYVGFSKI